MSRPRALINIVSSLLGALAIVLVVLIFTSGSHAMLVRSSSAGYSQLHTAGRRIYNAAGQQIVLTGVNDSGTLYDGQGNTPDSCNRYWPRTLIHPQVFSTIRSWGFNTIRVFISWANLEPTAPTPGPGGILIHHWNQRYLTEIDKLVHEALQHHVYLIIVMGQGDLSPAFKNIRQRLSPAVFSPSQCEGDGAPSWVFPDAMSTDRGDVETGWCQFLANQTAPGVPEAPQQGWAAADQEIARRYDHNPAVAGIDLINEPGEANYNTQCLQSSGVTLPNDYLNGFYNTIGKAIRQVNPHVMLVMEDSVKSQTYGHRLTSTGGLRNVIYEWHTYPSNWTVGRRWMVGELAYANKLDVPFYVGEFDAFGADSDHSGCLDANPTNCQDPNWQSDLSSMMAYMKGHDISWTLESYESPSLELVDRKTGQVKTSILLPLRAAVTSSSTSGRVVALVALLITLLALVWALTLRLRLPKRS